MGSMGQNSIRVLKKEVDGNVLLDSAVKGLVDGLMTHTRIT
jgi:hypothetical protein